MGPKLFFRNRTVSLVNEEKGIGTILRLSLNTSVLTVPSILCYGIGSIQNEESLLIRSILRVVFSLDMVIMNRFLRERITAGTLRHSINKVKKA